VRILSIRPAPPSAGTQTLAYFDAQVTEDLRLYGFALREFPDGNRRTIAPPNAAGRHAASFTPHLGSQLTAAASAALERPHDRTSRS